MYSTDSTGQGKSLFAFAASVAAQLLLVVGAAMAQPALPKPEDIIIKNVTAGGPGCPQGSYSVLLTSSVPGGPADFFEVVFDSFSVEKGPSVLASEGRKHCTVVAELFVPQGFRFAIADVHYEGYASIPKGSTGIMKTEYFFPFFSNRVSATKNIPGEFTGDYSRDDTLSLFPAVWSPCGKNIPLNMKSTLELRGPATDRAFMTVDQQTGILTQKWALQWATCES